MTLNNTYPKRKYRRPWAWPWELHRQGVLGINERNLRYQFPLNPRSLYHRVDDKVETKKICKQVGIPVPQLFVVISRYGDVRKLFPFLRDKTDFVIKPASGASGRGVLIIVGRSDTHFHTAQGDILSWEEIRYHTSTILSGLYSLAGHPDRVIIEQRIVPHPLFNNLTVTGTPDIRIILYQSQPIMAMLRLPTIASQGRANLHQGAVAVGIDMTTGITFGGVCRDRYITHHPDTGVTMSNIQIPDWETVLDISRRLSRAIGMGYLGVDIVLDETIGPVVLEANARPGLAIQIANRSGLKKQLRGKFFQ